MIAAIVHEHGDDVDRVLAAFAARQLGLGCRVRGLVNLPHESTPTGKRMALRDVTDPSSYYPISQALGAAACGCNLDPGGIADASAVLRRALHEQPDLVVANRFGTLEAQGQGMADELLALMSAGIPLLTAVKLPYRDAWREFTGGLAAELPVDEAAVQAWWDACRPTRGAAA